MSDVRFSSSLALSRTTTAPRATPPSGGQRFRAALASTADTVLGSVESMTSFLPGARTVATAVRAGVSSPPAAGPASGALGGLGGAGTALETQADQAMGLLQLQQQIGLEQQRFQTVSNVLKARHDTAKSVIGNVR